MQVNMTNRILQVSSIARQQLRILLFAIFNAWAIGYARRLTMFHLVPAEVKASGPIRTSLYEREGSIRPLEATFTEALQAPCLKPPNHPFEASKRTVWSLQTPEMARRARAHKPSFPRLDAVISEGRRLRFAGRDLHRAAQSATLSQCYQSTRGRSTRRCRWAWCA